MTRSRGTSSAAQPLLTVIMPVYNGEEYLRPAIDSVLAQTFTDFELIIMNDGSTDASREILETYHDKRIRLVHQKNRGLVGTLNRAIGLAQGEYIARHDCDDVSRRDRFELQVQYLNEHQDVGLLGSSYRLLNDEEKVIGRFIPFLDDTTVRQDFLLHNPFGHGTVMFRRSTVDEIGLYAPLKYTEDYEYWWRFAGASKVVNLPEPLYDWRVLQSSMSRTRQARSNWMLINRLRKKIWRHSDIAALCKKDYAQRAKFYLEHPDPAFYHQFITLQIALCIALQAQGCTRQSYAHLLRVIGKHPRMIKLYFEARRTREVSEYDLNFFFDTKLG